MPHVRASFGPGGSEDRQARTGTVRRFPAYAQRPLDDVRRDAPFRRAWDGSRGDGTRWRSSARMRRLPVWALGPIVLGAFWECTAVPDIRVQATTLARSVSGAFTPATPR